MFSPQISERFWSKVDRGLPDDCWTWAGGKTGSKGYGAFCFDSGYVYAHRFSYMLHYGDIPGEQVVMHTCDNALCVNPGHLRLGTQQDNIQDAVDKGRWMTEKRKAALAGTHEKYRQSLANRTKGRTPGEALYFQRLIERSQS